MRPLKEDMNTHWVAVRPSRQDVDLSAIRQTKGISLEQIAQASKINIRYLRAIEEGQFDKLPGGIFNTSYIRQYAKAIEYEEALLLAYYSSQAS